ncbi:MAG: phospholipase D-like domain-containing protein [Pseudomonadota bacterium]|nr:phospholipase D-like domain-containing protein [Pseudomonadota bacterium]
MLFYVIAAPEPIDRPPHTFSGNAAATGAIGSTLSVHLGAPRSIGNDVDLLVNGDEIFPAMLDSIRGARESVNLLTYVYWRGDIAEEFAGELAAAARRGVRVRVLLDAYGARKIDPDWVDAMRRAGCEVAWFNPLRWNTLHLYNHRTHRKVLVVDGQVGFTGGVGIAQAWTGNAQDPDHWRDDHFRVEGPAVLHLQGSFAESWRRATGVVLTDEALDTVPSGRGNAEVVVVSAEGVQRFGGIPMTYWVLIRSARRTLRIATPYYVPDPDLELGVLDAARRGVEVTLLIPGPHQDSALVRYAMRSYYHDLLAAGVRVHEYQPTLMHTKLLMVDDQWALIGSPNMDSRSFEINDEIALAVSDEDLLHDLSASYAADLAASRRVTSGEVTRNPVARLRNWSARLLREQL